MRKFLSLCVIAAAASTLFAQEYHEPSKAALAYESYRVAITEPSYGLAKVKALIKTTKRVEGEEGEGSQKLTDKQYNSLSFKEKFTYIMLHEESFSQNCDMMPILEDADKHISAWPSTGNGDSYWSPRQLKFLKDNRTRVLELIRETMRQKHRVGSNLKQAILETNGWELIPDMVAVYNRDHKDHDILSVLMILMKENKFKPFLASSSYTKLYGENASHQSFLNANTANQKLEISRAMAFYNSRKK